MATRKPSSSDAVAIHAVAKAANLSSRELMDAIQEWDLGWDATNHMKRLSQEQIEEVARRLNADLSSILSAKPAKKAPAKPKDAKPAAKAAATDEAAAKDKAPAKSKQDAPKAANATPAPDKKSQRADDKKEDAQPAQAADTSADADAKSAAKEAAKAAAESVTQDAKPAREERTKDDAAAKETSAKQDQDADAQDEHAEDTTSPEEIAERAKEILENILDGMGFAHPRIRVEVSKEAVRISLSGRGTAEILGQRNASARTDVLEALQLVVQKSLFGNEHRNGPAVAIDVMGFREGREQELRAMAERMAAYVEKTGNVLRIAAMNFIDRRAVHQAISAHDDVRTESTGYGTLRALEVSYDQRSKHSKDDQKNDRRDERNAERQENNNERDTREHDDQRDKNDRREKNDDRHHNDKKGGRKSSRRDRDDRRDDDKSHKSRAKQDAHKDAQSNDDQNQDRAPKSDRNANNAADEGGKSSQSKGEEKSQEKRSGRKPRKSKDDAKDAAAPRESDDD